MKKIYNSNININIFILRRERKEETKLRVTNSKHYQEYNSERDCVSHGSVACLMHPCPPLSSFLWWHKLVICCCSLQKDACSHARVHCTQLQTRSINFFFFHLMLNWKMSNRHWRMIYENETDFQPFSGSPLTIFKSSVPFRQTICDGCPNHQSMAKMVLRYSPNHQSIISHAKCIMDLDETYDASIGQKVRNDRMISSLIAT